jgi:hypothetical protein
MQRHCRAYFLLRHVDSPNAEQLFTADSQVASRINPLEQVKPCESSQSAFPMKKGHDSIFIASLIQRIRDFSLDPHRFHRGRREKNNEPVAAIDRIQNLVLPLPRTDDIVRRKENRNSVGP